MNRISQKSCKANIIYILFTPFSNIVNKDVNAVSNFYLKENPKFRSMIREAVEERLNNGEKIDTSGGEKGMQIKVEYLKNIFGDDYNPSRFFETEGVHDTEEKPDNGDSDIREEAKKEIFFVDYDGDKFPNGIRDIMSKEGVDFLEERNIDNLYEFACYLLANNYHLEGILEDYLSRIDELIDDDFLSFDDDGTLDFYTISRIIEESYDQVTDILGDYRQEVDVLGEEAFEVLGTRFVRTYGNTLQSLLDEIVKNLTGGDLDMIDYFLPSYNSERQIELYNEYIEQMNREE